MTQRRWFWGIVGCLIAIWALVLAPPQGVIAQSARPSAGGSAAGRTDLLGGPTGVVRTDKGQPVEGLMVQLVSEKTAIRTTVFTDDSGAYEFPRLEAGEYTLRLARPREYRPYRKDDVRIDGASKLPDITVTRVAGGEFLPPTVDVLTQLSGAELLHNLPGTVQEKNTWVSTCGGSCHSFDHPFRARFDERGWHNLISRMTNYRYRIMIPPGRGEGGGMGAPLSPNAELVKNWLARVRAPGAEDPPIKPFARPIGRARRVVITEYELPWTLVNIHDVYGDPAGNVWFTINRSPFIGKLDPKTGKVTSYRVPTPPPMEITSTRAYEHKDPPGIHPGIHWIQVDPQTGIVWFSDTWSEALGRLDPRTGDIKQVNIGVHGNIALSRDGKKLWKVENGRFNRWDTATVVQKSPAMPEKTYSLMKVRSTYGTCVSWDDRYVGGGAVWLDTQTGEVREFSSASGWIDAGRCDFDPAGNIWAGSKDGPLIKYNPKTGAVSEYATPTPFTSSYGARSDKNGEIWYGLMHGARVARFNSKTEEWTQYDLPSTYSFDTFAWVDNSTTPVTFWMGDQHGYITRVQPLDP